MFAVQEIGRLSERASRDAITVPLKGNQGLFSEQAIATIIKTADGYPYFIQFICREAFDYLVAKPHESLVPIQSITRKLDANFFSGRWEILTDRQRELLQSIAQLEHADEEFSIMEIVDSSRMLSGVKPFSTNDVSQMLPRLIERGLVYKNRFGKYAFAVPLFSGFIRRRYSPRAQQGRLF
jgi:hypothetical protein